MLMGNDTAHCSKWPWPCLPAAVSHSKASDYLPSFLLSHAQVFDLVQRFSFLANRAARLDGCLPFTLEIEPDLDTGWQSGVFVAHILRKGIRASYIQGGYAITSSGAYKVSVSLLLVD